MQNNSASSGFTAGTLVHTKDGLVPIEKIKVGDLVLSRSEHPEAGVELAFKRVLKVHVHDDLEIKQIGYKLGLDSMKERTYRLFVTPNHAFWEKSREWVASWMLEGDWMGPSHLELFSRATAYSHPQYVYKTSTAGVGWITFAGFEGKGVLYDFSENKGLETAYFDTKNWPIHEVIDGGDGDGYRYTATVYNLEVEDFHSYFVGEHGVLVKSA